LDGDLALNTPPFTAHLEPLPPPHQKPNTPPKPALKTALRRTCGSLAYLPPSKCKKGGLSPPSAYRGAE